MQIETNMNTINMTLKYQYDRQQTKTQRRLLQSNLYISNSLMTFPLINQILG